MIDTVSVFGTDNVGWSIDRDAQGWVDFLSLQPQVLQTNMFYAHRVVCVWHEQLLRMYPFFFLLRRITKKKLVAVVTNDIRAMKPTSFFRLCTLVDVWVAPNRTVETWLHAQGVRVVYMPFFVSPKTFFPIIESKAYLAQQLGVDVMRLEGSFLIGSFQRDSLGADLQCPKWQKDPDLLLALCEALLKLMPILLILSGPRRHYVVNQCRKRKIPYIFVGDERLIDLGCDDIQTNLMSPERMNVLYNLVDVTVVSSVSEAGPKNIYESILAQTPVVSTRVGIAPEVVHPSCLFLREDVEVIAETIFHLVHDQTFRREVVRYNFDHLTPLLSHGARQIAWQQIHQYTSLV